MTDPLMYKVSSAVLCRSLAIVWSLPLSGGGDYFLSYWVALWFVFEQGCLSSAVVIEPDALSSAFVVSLSKTLYPLILSLRKTF